MVEIDHDKCTGCGECIPNCPEGALQIIDGKARLVADKLCDGLGACLGHCPTGALQIIEREAEAFDEKAVEEFLAEQKKQQQGAAQGIHTGCPSAQLKTFSPDTPCSCADEPSTQPTSALSQLSHWPVQIRLIPPNAPFLENCDLLIAADCTTVTYSALQENFIKGRVVMMGCPKFDDQQLYADRFTELFKTRKLNSITILIMEVPCCSAMLEIVKKAYKDAEAEVPVRQVVVSTRGKLVDERRW